MSVNRREFVKISALASAGLLLARERAYAAFAQSPGLQKFVQKMRLFGVDIPLATPTRVPMFGTLVDSYQIAMKEYTDTLHPNLGPTSLRGYCDLGSTPKHLSGAILATQGVPVRVRWHNQLTDGGMPLPVDASLVQPYTYGQSLGHGRAAVHLHGGLVPWPSDGGPFHWFSAGHTGAPGSPGASSVVGPSVMPWLPEVDAAGNPTSVLTSDYWYPNNQSARFMWYHDHAVGITRLNAYAGLATGYLLTDDAEKALMNTLQIPFFHPVAGGRPPHQRQVPIVVQDKIFAPNQYGKGSTGDIWYPDTYDTQFFELAESGEPPSPSEVSEFWGDTMLINGTVYPYLDVEPRRYRLRILNACNTRFLSLRLVAAAGKSFPDSAEPDLTEPGPVMTVIGSEGGFLDGLTAPRGVEYTNRATMPLVLAPAERSDILVDFSRVHAVSATRPTCFILYNEAPVPYPGGTDLGDFYPENKKLAMPPAPGYGPNTRTLLQFRVLPLGAVTGDSKPDPTPGAWELPPSPAPQPTEPGTRDLALYEVTDSFGRLAQNLGTLPFPLAQVDAPTEVVRGGTVEVWRVFNTTGDAHPIHFHYVNVRVLDRQPFLWKGGEPMVHGSRIPPEPCEQGWKETVRMNPGECIRLLVEVPALGNVTPPGVTIPESPRLAAPPYSMPSAQEYVWHCHILEHEEHDMMRPLIVIP